MKCPHCGKDIILPGYKFCPACRKPVNVEISEQPQEIVGNNISAESKSFEGGERKAFGDFFRRKPSNNGTTTTPLDVEVVKNKVVWNLNVGEIARRINIDEFDRLENVKGVYIQDGVKAVVIIDGDKVLEFESGLYYLAGRVERTVSLVRRVIDFFKGRRRGESDKEYDMRRNQLDIALQALKGNSVVEVILIADGYIPVVLNVGVQNGNRVFVPYKIPSKYSTLDMGVSLHMQVTDYRMFQTNYLGRNRTFRIAELQDLIKDIVGNELKRLFAETNIQSSVIPAEMENAVRSALKGRINMNLYGIEVMQVVDVTMDNEDFNRFREIEHRLYCTQNELDYLIRTNTFRNRLQDEKNAQKIREAKTEEELRYALQQVNKDQLLHDEEFAAFVDLLESQRRLRIATTEEDEHEAMLRIKKNRLVADDDYAALENEMAHRKLNRDEADDILRIQSSQRITSEIIEAEKLTAIKTIRSEQEKEGALYEAASQIQVHVFESEGRVWEHDKERQKHNIQMDDELGRYQQTIDDRDIEHKGKYADYEHGQRVRNHGQDVVEERDTIETEDIRKQKEFDRVKDYLDLSMGNMERMSEMEIREQEAAAKIEREKEAQKLQHEEQMERLKATIIDAKQRMTAEQLAATQLDKMSTEAQVAFAEALSKAKELNIERLATREKIELYEKMAQMSQEYANANIREQKDMMAQMMNMMQEAMKTNADVAKSAVSGHNATIYAQMDTIRDVAGGRYNDMKSMKDEYRAESHGNREYAQHTADSALKYTTDTNRGKSTAGAFSSVAGSGKVELFIVPILGKDGFSLETMIALIHAGTVLPNTIIVVDGMEMMAKDHGKLRQSFSEKNGKKCPHCGKEGCLGGEICPECGKEI